MRKMWFTGLRHPKQSLIPFGLRVAAGMLALLVAGVGLVPSASAAADSPYAKARAWFASEGNKLAAATAMYLPSQLEVAPDSKPEVGEIAQVSTWTNAMLKGTYSLQNSTIPIDMWVAPVTQGGIALGVVVYTEPESQLFPTPLPKKSDLAPKPSEGIPEPTLTSNALTAGVVEPKNSHLAVKADPPGAAYILPELARALIAAPPSSERPNFPVYDPVVDGWFILVEDQLTPVSAAARARLRGTAGLLEVREAIQSWWGTAKTTPTPEPTVAGTSAAPTVFSVVSAALIGAGLVGLLIWLSLRRQSDSDEEVLPLPDPELIIVPPPPHTSAIPTLPRGK